MLVCLATGTFTSALRNTLGLTERANWHVSYIFKSYPCYWGLTTILYMKLQFCHYLKYKSAVLLSQPLVDTFGQGACDPPPGRIRAVLFYQMAQVKQTDPMQIRRAKKDKSVPLDNRSLVGDGINQVNLPSTEKYTLSSFRPYR